MDYYVGIDIGTTNIKAAAYTLDGEQRAFFSSRTPVHSPQTGWSEFYAEELWQGACGCLRRIAKAVGGEGIRAVAVSSMAESGVAVDERGTPLCPVIAWYDQRCQPQAQRLQEKLGYKRLYWITGQIPSEKYGVGKLMWVRENLPDAARRMRRWLSVEDYILYRLTGKYATDYSIAARTMLFDIHALDWSGEVAGAAGVPLSLFPPAYPGGTAVGRVTEEAAAETGLPPSAVAVTGGHDHACAGIGTDILSEGVVLDSMGTSECSMIAAEAPLLNSDTFSAYSSIYPHCGQKIYRVLSSIQACGATIEWFLDTVGREIGLEAARMDTSKYQLMERDAAASTQDGLYFLPFLRGSIENMKMRGTFVGLKSSHNLGDMARAMMDSLCYELCQHIECYERVFSVRLHTIRAVGGLSKSGYFIRTKANLTGKTVELPVHTQAACFGAAILSAVGAQAIGFGDISSLYRRKEVCRPQTDGKPIAEDYQRYLILRGELKSLYDRYY